MEQAKRFRSMFSSLGLSVQDVANFLQVTPRTVQLWVSGRVRIPYAAYKLLRLQLRYELPGQHWQGWHLSAGRLYTPEGHELDPRGFACWSLLARQAASFRTVYQDNTRLRLAAVASVQEPRDSAGAIAPATGRRLVTRPGILTGERNFLQSSARATLGKSAVLPLRRVYVTPSGIPISGKRYHQRPTNSADQKRGAQ